MIFAGKWRVTSPYGARVLNGKNGFHRGIDVVGITDNHVLAVVSGTVGYSGMVTDKNNRTWEWGNYVRIDGIDGKKYYYCHLDKRLVSAGQHVRAGDHIGIMGNTGYSFGTHTHFEIRNEQNVSMNPAPALGIPNREGTYGMDDRAAVQNKFALSDDTMQYIDNYKYSADLYKKLNK